MARLKILGRLAAANWRRLAVFGLMAGGVILAYALGRSGAAVQQAAALPPGSGEIQAPAPPPVSTPNIAAEGPGTQVLCFLYGATMRITRQEFGDFLIARQSKRLDYLVNKTIIEHECNRRGITISEAEVEEAILEDLGKMQVSKKDFLQTILKRYNMSFYEWREDVIKPQLLMSKYVRAAGLVTVDESDLEKAYESQFGDQVECRIIVWSDSMGNDVRNKLYDMIRKSPEEFDRQARQQSDPGLAAGGGNPGHPIVRHSLTNPDMEREVFSLREGEVSPIYQDGPDRLIVFKCVKHIPAQSKDLPPLQELRNMYDKVILEVKTREAIPKLFEQMKKDAKVEMLVATPDSEKEWLQRVKESFKNLETPQGTVPAELRTPGS